MKVFIIHGSYGNPYENWFPWLKEKLEKNDNQVIIPNFPTPDNQILENWMKIIIPYFENTNKDVIFVGHSLGPAFILSVLEKINHPIKACFFVAGFIGDLKNTDFDKINNTFTNKSFDWKKIRENCPRFIIINSKDDPYVPLEKGKELANNLNTELIIFEKAGHFNESSGFTKFPELLEMIEKEN